MKRALPIWLSTMAWAAIIQWWGTGMEMGMPPSVCIAMAASTCAIPIPLALQIWSSPSVNLATNLLLGIGMAMGSILSVSIVPPMGNSYCVIVIQLAQPR